MEKLLTLKEASQWASEYLEKQVTVSNISYLIQYGKVKKYGRNGTTSVSKQDLLTHYTYDKNRETSWKKKLGNDLNWELSFNHLNEKDTTKHVHRIHPYKGKFIPQLVEYFLDSHKDNFKQEVYFKKGDIVLDPFSGSGTTMVQANELGVHSLGIDISAFNSLISNTKIRRIDFEYLERTLEAITNSLEQFTLKKNNRLFENELLQELNIFNKTYFPSPDYKVKIRQGEINEKEYSSKKEKEFIHTFNKLTEKFNLNLTKKDSPSNFLQKWYLEPIKSEIYFVYKQINNIDHQIIKDVITIILSRTMRSCRATTHSDLATLKEPVYQTYYCKKHGKICKPLFSMVSWWKRYSEDTVKRLYDFDRLRTDTIQYCLQGDAREVDVLSRLEVEKPDFLKLINKQKIRGIFSSPPYIGLIDYHEQHAYAYDLFGFKRNDEFEIGPLYKGQGEKARHSYIEEIAKVLNNSKQYLQKNYDIFLVANDKYNIYPIIAEKAGMRIFNQYKRPVLNRTEKDKSAYAEIIFHLKEKQQ